jgi:uncharacterized cupredoxin-like copper-binding protein
MVRTLLAVAFAFGLVGFAASDASAQKAQMVKGTIKSADASKSLLVINQIVKDEKVDRELSITATTTFTIKDGDKTQEATGKEGLLLLKGREGATVAVKCDKDVNVLSVTVTVGKKK